MQDLAAFLREYRKRKGISYAVFSRDYFGGELSAQTLKNLETGHGEPRLSTLRVISEKLGVDLRWLVHCALGLTGAGEKVGAAYMDEIGELAARVSEEERRLLLSFARFMAWEGCVRPGPRGEAPREDAGPPETVLEAVSGRERRYIMEVLEKLEEDWRRTMEEENPFA